MMMKLNKNCLLRYYSSFSNNSNNLINVNKNLKIKCIIFDIFVLCGNENEYNERRKIEIEKEYSDKQTIPIPTPVYDLSKEIENVSTIQTKYMNKIRKRIGDKSIVDATSPIKETDAKLLNIAKTIPTPNETKKPLRWLLQVGMGDVLDYSSFRSINVAVLNTKKASFNLIDQLAGQITNINFYKINKTNDDKLKLIDKFSLMEENLKIIQKECLLISSNEEIIASAKERGYYTCRYRSSDSLYGQQSTDFQATSAIEVQDCIEELNGIGMRPSAYHSRAW